MKRAIAPLSNTPLLPVVAVNTILVHETIQFYGGISVVAERILACKVGGSRGGH